MTFTRKYFFPATVLLLTLFITPAAMALPNETAATRMQQFVTTMKREHGINEQVLRNALATVNWLDVSDRPSHERSLYWPQYRALFLTEARIAAGIDYWYTHQNELMRAERLYGVPSTIITAIIGIETNYGRFTGRQRVLDVLASYGFLDNRRRDFFYRELTSFVLLSNEDGVSLTEQYGSVAGAMGIAQFIPSSYRHYAVDFDGDGKRDLPGSDSDAIGSIANYLAQHQWQRGKPIVEPLLLTTTQRQQVLPYLTRSLQPPTMTAATWHGYGILTDVPSSTTVDIMSLPLSDATNDVGYWAIWQNFYAITRYNHSQLYALAVYALSERVREGIMATQ